MSLQLAVSLVRDGAGEPLHFVAQIQDISERKSLEQRLRHLADTDPLTGLWNRRSFEAELAQQARRCERYGEQAALLVLDLDGFKATNDAEGHQAGDRALRRAAGAMRAALRTSDMLARIGGDEFAALLLHVSPAAARRCARAGASPGWTRSTPIRTPPSSPPTGRCTSASTPERSRFPRQGCAAGQSALYLRPGGGRPAMCLAIPGQVLEIIDDERRLAQVDVAGVRRTVNVGLLDSDPGGGIEEGDWVLIHVGFALSKVDEEEARSTLRMLQGMGQDYEQELEELKASVIE